MSVMGGGFLVLFGNLDITSKNKYTLKASPRTLDAFGSRSVSISGNRSIKARHDRSLDEDSNTVYTQIITDYEFNDASAWSFPPGSSRIESGQMIVVNCSGFIFPEPRNASEISRSYQYEIDVASLSNPSGNGRITFGGATIWTPSDGAGIKNGEIIATDTAGLVFNFLFPYLGNIYINKLSVFSFVTYDRRIS